MYILSKEKETVSIIEHYGFIQYVLEHWFVLNSKSIYTQGGGKTQFYCSFSTVNTLHLNQIHLMKLCTRKDCSNTWSTIFTTQLQLLVYSIMKIWFSITCKALSYLITLSKHMASLRVSENDPFHSTVLDHRWAERTRRIFYCNK